MFYDVKISNEQINPNYKQWLENKGKTMDCQLSVTLLNDNIWPPATKVTLNPAPDFMPCKTAFEDFFGCAQQKKTLAWMYQSGDTDVHYSFAPKPGAKPLVVELNISCTQASVCLLFNHQKQIKFGEILETLGCTEEHLKYSITPLLYTKDRFLANKGADGKGKKEVDDDGKQKAVTWDSLQKDDYLAPCLIKQPKRRQVYPPLKPLPPGEGKQQKETQEEIGEDLKQVIKERELKMQLALVRVMKARNTLMVNQLIAEATEQLSKYFVPEVRLMRKQIEVLMERGFMKRDDDDQKKIHYVA